MALTLLQIVQRSASGLGLRQPSAVVGSQDLTAQILLQFAIEAGEHLRDYHDWQALTVQHTVSATATTTQIASAIPSDFARFPRGVEVWDRSAHIKYFGPTPQRKWAQLMNGIGSGITRRWRLVAGRLLLYPAPTSGNTLAFEYVSKNYCQSSGGTNQETWMADTDVSRIPEHLFQHEIKWRFRASRGFPGYAEDMSTAEREKEKAASRDRGLGNLRDDAGPNDPIYDGGTLS